MKGNTEFGALLDEGRRTKDQFSSFVIRPSSEQTTQEHSREANMIIEWNTHIFSSDLERYPFHPDATYTPDMSRRFEDPLAAYMERMEEEGIDRAVLVQSEPYGDDHRLVLESLDREPERFKATSLFYPRDPEAPRKLEELVQQKPKIVATRFHGSKAYLDTFADPGVRALWKKAAELGLIVELHIGPMYAAGAAEVIQMYPETTVLIDHLAEPHTGNPVQFADVLDLARFDRVYMKLSGLNHFSKDEPLYLEARPFTRWVIDAFGPDRMVWGSGTPGIVDAHMTGFSAEDRDKVKGGNLAELLGFV